MGSSVSRPLAVFVVVTLLAPAPCRAEAAGAVAGRSPALDDWEPYVGLHWRSRPTLLGLDARGRPVVEVARRVMVVVDDGATAAPGSASAKVTPLRPVPVRCRLGDRENDRPGTKRCSAELPGSGLTLRSAETLDVRDAKGREAVLAAPFLRLAKLVQVAVSVDGSRWVSVWSSNTFDGDGLTLFGTATGSVTALRARLAGLPLREWLSQRRPRAAPHLVEAQQLAPFDAPLAVTLARVHARLGRDEAAMSELRPHLSAAAIATYAAVSRHPELDRLKPRFRALLAGAAHSQPATAAAPARWRRQFVIGESADGRYLALRRDNHEDCKGDHHRYLEIVQAAPPYRRVATLQVEHLDADSGREDGRPWLALNRRSAADDLLAAFGFVPVPLIKATSVVDVDPKRRFRYSPERLGVVSMAGSSTARLLRDGRVAAEVHLPGKRWDHGDATVQEVALDLQRRRVFLRWGEANPACCAGGARMPLDHDQISIVPLP
jgi:hypothetical protein